MSLLEIKEFTSRQEVLGKPSPVPRQSGVYAWYFKKIPPNVPVDNCHSYGPYTLLYVGISPKEPPKNGSAPSKQTLFNRIHCHCRGNAKGSTLRLTLGCLLADTLNIQLRRVGSGARITFGDGERVLSQWMEENAFVVWVVHPEPWLLEAEVIGAISLPLNLRMNNSHPFYNSLSQIRKNAKKTARALPIVS